MMIEKLREETRLLHEEIEKENPANLIMDHSITLEIYKLLLLKNYVAYRSVENAISEYLPVMQTKKYLELEKDLKALNIPFSEIPVSAEFSCNSKPEAFGAAYVIEGSALGGMLLARNLKKCSMLEEVEEFHFFSGHKDNLQSWKSFKNALAEQDFSEEEIGLGVEKAKETFSFFKRSFLTDFSVFQ